MKKKKITAVHVHGLLWTDRKNGNTYHSAQIYINGEYAYPVPFQYGYGEGFIDSAAEVLAEKGIIIRVRNSNGSMPPLWKILKEDMGVKFYTTSEVTSKKRAEFAGKAAL